MTTIGNYAFSGCAMTSVKVPSTVTSLGSYAFANCANLAKAEFLSDVEVPFSTFENDDKLKEIISPSCYYDGLALYNKDKTTLFGVYNKSFTNDYIILETTTTIGDNAFGNCTGSATVTLPTSSLVKVGARAFCGCAKMRIKNLPETVKTIGDEAFYECKYLPASLTMSNAGIGNRAFQRTEGLATVSLSNATVGSNAFANSSLKSVSASDSLKIDNFAFAGCEELETLTLGNGVRNFAGGGIFSGCTSLRSVDGFNAADVPYNTFAGCSSLIYLQDTHMKTIGSRAFYNCKSLKGLYVDANQITSIGVEAFSGCEAFSSPWEFNNVDAVIGDGAFTGCENLNKFRFAGTANISDAASFADNTTIYVPKGTGEHYQALLPKCTIVEDYDASDLSLFYDDYNVPDYMPLVADKGSWVGDNVLTDVSQLSANYADEYEGSLANLLKDGRNYFLSGIDTENPQESPHYIQMDMKKGYKSFKIKMTRPSGMEDFAPVKVRILTSNSPEDESSWCDLGLDTLVYTNDTAVVNIDHYDKMRYVRMQVEATALNKKENGNLYFALSTLNLTPYQGQELKWDDGADWYHKNSSKLFLQGKNPIPAWYDRPDYLRSISLKTRIKKAVIIITKKSSISQTSWENTFYVPDGNFRSAERFAFRASSNSSTYEYVDTFKIDYKYRNDTIGCYCASFEEPISRFSLYCADSLTKGRYGYYFNEAYVIGNFHIYDRPRKMELLSNTERNEIQSIKDKVGKEQFLREADYRTLASYGAKMDALAQTGRWVDFINYDYCTFYADYPAVLPDSIKAGIVKEQNGELVVDYIYGAGSVIPANTGVIIKGNCRGNAYVFEEGTTDATSPEENLLHGTVVDEETYVDGCDRYYMLSFDKESDSRLGFYWNDADGPKPFVNKAYKAYLALPANVHAAKMNGFALDELEKGVAIGDITDIVNASHDGKRPNKGIYSIDGRQINASTTNNLPAGVYIVNGKKVMVK